MARPIRGRGSAIRGGSPLACFSLFENTLIFFRGGVRHLGCFRGGFRILACFRVFFFIFLSFIMALCVFICFRDNI